MINVKLTEVELAIILHNLSRGPLLLTTPIMIKLLKARSNEIVQSIEQGEQDEGVLQSI